MKLTPLQIGTFATVQPRYLDFPYSSWSYKPTEIDSGTYTIFGARYTFVFNLQGSAVRLAAPDIPEISHLINEPMEPGKLLFALLECGINLMPT